MPNGQSPKIMKVNLFINFFNVVDYRTITSFIEILQRASQGFSFSQGTIKKEIVKINVLMSCPGGILEAGIVGYNFLRQFSIDVDIYNLHNIDSAGVVVFCGAKKRYSLPDTRFLIHDISRKYEGQQENGVIQQTIEVGLFSKDNMVSIIAEICGKKDEEIQEMILKREGLLNSQEAKSFGLIDDIEVKLPSPSKDDMILSVR